MLRVARFIFALHKKEYHIGQIFRYTYKHLRNDDRPEIYIAKIRAYKACFARNYNIIISTLCMDI